MLKWTASATKMPQDTPVSAHRVASSTATIGRTPRLTEAKRRKRRATIANKENIPIVTSTPMVNRTRNSPLVLAPFADILNVTPEAVSSTRTPERRRVSIQAVPVTNTTGTTTRRHSSVGLSVASAVPQYATTLPKFEEEYSPNTMLPTGQQLALRGLLPDPFMGNRRYFSTPEVVEQEVKTISSLPKKRKLEMDFLAIAQEEVCQTKVETKLDNTGVVSNRMGDQTLDNLIDAILDSARKDEKKKKPRKSFNLRRRTLIKNQVDTVNDFILSPSYAAGDDPCSDLSFLGYEPSAPAMKKPFKAVTPQPASPIVVFTPEPVTPNPGTPLNTQQLLELPTPSVRNDSFSLATPVRPSLKRRSESKSCQNSSAKKYKVDSRNYFEIGLALPSIYV